MKNASLKTVVVVGLSMLLAGSASAETITDPTLYTEIDPAGGETINVTFGNTTEAAIEGMAGLRVIQTMQGSGLETFTVNGGNDYIKFNDDSVPDLEFAFRNGPVGQWRYANCGRSQTGSGANTSLGSSYMLAMNGGNNSGYLRIDLGAGDESSFDGSANSVDAFAFVLSAAYTDATYAATFYDNDDTVLGTYTASGYAASDELFFAHDDSANPGTSIGYVELYVTNTGAATWGGSMDDIAFVPVTIIPEPASALLLALAGLAVRRRRRG